MHLLLLSAALFAGADTEPATAPPKGPAPTILVAKVDAAGNLISEVTVTEVVPVTKEVEFNVNGKVEKRTVTAFEYRTKVVQQKRELSRATITTAGGKKLDRKDLAKRFAKPGVIVLSGDGKAVDAGYLKLFKADTVVIALPQGPPLGGPLTPPGGGATPVPVPIPVKP